VGLAAEGALILNSLGDHFAQLAVVERRRVAVHAHQLGRGACRCARNEVLDQLALHFGSKSAAASLHQV
jgi:hypothetical protein